MIAKPSLLMMKPDPLPDGVSIEMTASPYLLDQLLDRRGLHHARRVEPGGIELGSPRRASSRSGSASSTLARAQDLVRGNPQDIVAEIDVQRGRLLGDHLAGDALTVLEDHRFKFGCLAASGIANNQQIPHRRSCLETAHKQHTSSAGARSISLTFVSISSIVRIISILSTLPVRVFAPEASARICLFIFTRFATFPRDVKSA